MFLFFILIVLYSKMVLEGSVNKSMLLMMLMSIMFLGLPVSKMMYVLYNMILMFSTLFFLTGNVLLFYSCYEFTILPVGLMVLLWGTQPERISSLFYFSIYSVISAFPLMFILFSSPTYIMEFKYYSNFIMSLSMSLTFLVKMPLFGLHLWLPKAHVEAPSLGSIVLAGLLLKLGSWGLLSLSENIFLLGKPIWSLSLSGMTLGALMAMCQSDSKSLVAYSSVCHMNFMMLVFLFMPALMKSFSVIMMFAHGITSSYMFWITGMMFYKKYTRQMIYLGGLATMSSSMMTMTTIIFFTNFSVPPSISFFQEMSYLVYLMSISYFMMFFLASYLMVVCYYSLYYLNLFNMPSNMESCDSTLDNFLPLVALFLCFNWLLVSMII